MGPSVPKAADVPRGEEDGWAPSCTFVGAVKASEGLPLVTQWLQTAGLGWPSTGARCFLCFSMCQS